MAGQGSGTICLISGSGGFLLAAASAPPEVRGRSAANEARVVRCVDCGARSGHLRPAATNKLKALRPFHFEIISMESFWPVVGTWDVRITEIFKF